MRLYQDMPELTVAEAERLWLTPREVCILAAVGDPDRDRSIKRMLNTLSDRGHVPFVKTGPSKTHPRHYSLVSAAMLRVFAEMVETGRTYVYAQPVADEVAKLLKAAVEQVSDMGDLETRLMPWRLLYGEMTADGTPRVCKPVKGDLPIDELAPLDAGVFAAGYVVWRTIESYADFWLSRGGSR